MIRISGYGEPNYGKLTIYIGIYDLGKQHIAQKKLIYLLIFACNFSDL